MINVVVASLFDLLGLALFVELQKRKTQMQTAK